MGHLTGVVSRDAKSTGEKAGLVATEVLHEALGHAHLTASLPVRLGSDALDELREEILYFRLLEASSACSRYITI